MATFTRLMLLCIFLSILIFHKLAEVNGWNWKRTISVSLNGNDSACQVRLNSSCRTLDKAFEVALDYGPNSTLILVQSGHYYLKSSVNFSRVRDFALKGEILSAKPNVVVTCYPNVSLSFVLSDDLVFENIKYCQCGGWHESAIGEPEFRHHKHALFITALYFNYCRNITMTRIHVNGTPGVAVNMYNVGTAAFRECVFTFNKPGSSNSTDVSLTSAESLDFAVAGGGVFIQLGLANFNPIELSEADHSRYVNNHSYVFSNCNFTGNEAPEPELNATMDTPALPFSRGGGLAIYISGNGSRNRFVIEHNIFLRNEAQWGGGLQLEVQHRGWNNTFVVTNVTFEQNKAHFAGGGVRMGQYLDRTYDPPGFIANHFHFTKCWFIGNSATWGGGVSIYGTTRPVWPGLEDFHRKMVFSACHWRGNTANVGSAIGAFLFNTNEDEIGPRAPFHLELSNCSVTENKVSLDEHSVIVGQGAIYTIEVPIILKGTTSIENNSYTALVLDSATIQLGGAVLFRGNTGLRGGAMAIYGKSRLFFHSKSVLDFHDNSAQEKGGAIYYCAPGPPLVSFKSTGFIASPCFMVYEKWDADYDTWNTSIVFKGNAVGTGGLGNSIYATTLKKCRRTGETRKTNSAFDWKIVKFFDRSGNKTTAKDEIRTDPIDIQSVRKDWEKSPSENFEATTVLVDEKGNHVLGQVSVKVRSNSVVLTNGGIYLVQNDKLSSLQLTGFEEDGFNITLSTTGEQVVRQHIDNLVIQRCKDGLKQSERQCICESNDTGISHCDVGKGQVFIKSNYWAGRRHDTFITHHCPTGYCRCSKGAYCLYKKGEMCNKDRDPDSFLCGSCKKNWTVLIGSEECGPCTNWGLLWVMLYAAVLLVLVMLIMLINLDVFTGYLNAWLYSYQVITLLVIEGFEFDPFMNFVIGAANMQIQIGNGWCLMDGINDADKLITMYAMPTYVLFVVFMLTKAVRSYPNWCFSRHVRSPFGGICSILVLCYTDITGISLKILNPAFEFKTAVLYQDGDVKFFGERHIAYGVVALLYLMFIGVLFPLTLLCRPFFTRALRRVFNLNNLRNVYDSFQGVFNDEHRWCAAFYFVCRFVLLILFIAPSGVLKRLLLEASCILVLVVYVHIKPYRPEYSWINTSDTVLLTNLTFITMLSSGSITYSKDEATVRVLNILIKILAYVPLAYVLLLLAYLVWRHCRPPGDGDQGDQDSLTNEDPQSSSDHLE